MSEFLKAIKEKSAAYSAARQLARVRKIDASWTDRQPLPASRISRFLTYLETRKIRKANLYWEADYQERRRQLEALPSPPLSAKPVAPVSSAPSKVVAALPVPVIADLAPLAAPVEKTADNEPVAAAEPATPATPVMAIPAKPIKAINDNDKPLRPAATPTTGSMVASVVLLAGVGVGLALLLSKPAPTAPVRVAKTASQMALTA